MVGGVKNGVIRFIGEAQFAPEKWVGVELDDAGIGDERLLTVIFLHCGS